MIYYIITFIVTVLIAYVVGLTIVTLIDRHLGKISINLPKQNVVVNLPEKERIEGADVEDNMEHFNNYNSRYILNKKILNDPIPQFTTSICYENHNHVRCLRGEMKYPEPRTMSPIDRRYFKYNYAGDFALQDYINWLYLYLGSEDELPYEHLRNLNKLKQGTPIKTIPTNVSSVPINSAEYFLRMYNEDIDIAKPLNLKLYGLDGYNYHQYPKPIISYQRYKQPHERTTYYTKG